MRQISLRCDVESLYDLAQRFFNLLYVSILNKAYR